jgi:ABC-type microcin C transport system permease subunit YejE
MDMSAAILNLNWLAVLVAAVSTFLIGGIWYKVFEKGWLSSNRTTLDELKGRNMALIFGLAFLFSLFMALNLALFIGAEGVYFGTLAGFFTGFGFVFFAIGIISLFENRPFLYVLINGGYMIVSFTVMGAIIGVWH